MLSSVGFSGVDVLFTSPWLHGVENPTFVAVHFQDILMYSTSVFVSTLIPNCLPFERVLTTEQLCSNRWYYSQFKY